MVDDDPPSRPAPPEQSSLNKFIGTKKEEPPASTEEKTGKQKKCPHPYSEVVRLSDGITVCNHCYDMIEFPLVA